MSTRMPVLRCLARNAEHPWTRRRCAGLRVGLCDAEVRDVPPMQVAPPPLSIGCLPYYLWGWKGIHARRRGPRILDEHLSARHLARLSTLRASEGRGMRGSRGLGHALVGISGMSQRSPQGKDACVSRSRSLVACGAAVAPWACARPIAERGTCSRLEVAPPTGVLGICAACPRLASRLSSVGPPSSRTVGAPRALAKMTRRSA